MGKLVKNHWARLMTLAAAACQLLAAIEAFFWPKILWDYYTDALDGAIKPYPILQSINIFFALVTLAFEWPLPFLAGTAVHRSIGIRLLWLPLAAASCVAVYQASHPFVYYLIATGVYLWAEIDGEVICAKPWSQPEEKNVPGKV